MTFALLPVKNPAQAKRRLASMLTAGERAQLAWLLYRHTLNVLRSVERLDKVVVVSSDPGVLDHARREGGDVIVESAQRSHSDSADAALAQCLGMGAARVLLLPVDVPLLNSTDIEQVIETAGTNGAPQIVIVPSADGTGTNALLQSPPCVIPCCFGPGSFEAHRREGALRGVTVTIASPPGLTFDLDDAKDVISMMANDHEGDVHRYLLKIRAAERAEEYLSRKKLVAQSRT
jgi:2-phospho-L-lactate guanylyltransferase